MVSRKTLLLVGLLMLAVFLTGCERCGDNYCSTSEIGYCVSDCYESASCSDTDDAKDIYAHSLVTYDYTFDLAKDGVATALAAANLTEHEFGIVNGTCNGTQVTTPYCTNNLMFAGTYDCAREGLTCEAGACVIGDIDPSGDVNKSVRLDGPFSGNVVVLRDNVTIDCQGNSITGTGTGIQVGAHKGVNVKNCFVAGYTVGINLSAAENAEVTDNLLNNTYDVVLPDPQQYDETNLGTANWVYDNTLISGFGYLHFDVNTVDFRVYDYYNWYDAQNQFNGEMGIANGTAVTDFDRANDFYKDVFANTSALAFGLCDSGDVAAEYAAKTGDTFLNYTCTGESSICVGDGRCYNQWKAAPYVTKAGKLSVVPAMASHKKVKDVVETGSIADKKKMISVSNPVYSMIVPADNCALKVTYEKKGNAFKTEFYLESPNTQLVFKDADKKGKNYYLYADYDPNVGFSAGEEIVFSLGVDLSPWKTGIYKHFSNDSNWTMIDQLDSHSWRIYFEGFDSKGDERDGPNRGFNDAVILIEAECTPTNSTPIADCDNDTIPDDIDPDVVCEPEEPDCDGDGIPDSQDADLCEDPEPDCDLDGIPDYMDLDDTSCDGIVEVGDYGADGVITNYDTVESSLLGSHTIYYNDYFIDDDTLTFDLYGYNNWTGDADFTFAIYDNESNVVYQGTVANPNETLELPVSTYYYAESFSLEISSSIFTSGGKHTLYIQDAATSAEKFIGDFFVIIPEVRSEITLTGPSSTYTNIPLGDATNPVHAYSKLYRDIPEYSGRPKNLQLIYITPVVSGECYADAINCGENTTFVDIDVNVSSDNDTIPDNDKDIILSSSKKYGHDLSFLQNISDYHTAKIWMEYNGTVVNESSMDYAVWITEETAMQYGYDIWKERIDAKHWSGFFDMWTGLNQGWGENYVVPTGAGSIMNIDRWFNHSFWLTGDEYITQISTINNPTYYWSVDYDASPFDLSGADEPFKYDGEYLISSGAVNNIGNPLIDGCSCWPTSCRLIHGPSTGSEYNQTLNNYITAFIGCNPT